MVSSMECSSFIHSSGSYNSPDSDKASQTSNSPETPVLTTHYNFSDVEHEVMRMDDKEALDLVTKRIQAVRSSRHHLWTFLIDLLMDTSKNSVLSWEDDMGMFRIKEPLELAKLWGKQRNRSTMTYETLSRSLRHYYEKKILHKVPKKKFTYNFNCKEIIRSYYSALPLFNNFEHAAGSQETERPSKTRERQPPKRVKSVKLARLSIKKERLESSSEMTPSPTVGHPLSTTTYPAFNRGAVQYPISTIHQTFPAHAEISRPLSMHLQIQTPQYGFNKIPTATGYENYYCSTSNPPTELQQRAVPFSCNKPQSDINSTDILETIESWLKFRDPELLLPRGEFSDTPANNSLHSSNADNRFEYCSMDIAALTREPKGFDMCLDLPEFY